MDHSIKKQQHEKARKQHKQELEAHAREAARRGRSRLPLVFLVIGIVVIIASVAMISLR